MIQRTLLPLISLAGATFASAQTEMIKMGDVGGLNNEFAKSSANIGDVNGDGISDFAIGVPSDDAAGVDSGKVMIMSGRNGGPIATAYGPSPGSQFGWCVRYGGDVDGNGTTDILVGAPYWSNATGRVHVCEAQTGSVVLILSGSAPGDLYGYSLDSMGDLNGSGRPDIAIGIPGWSSNRGRVLVYEPINLAVIFGWSGGTQSSEQFGRSLQGSMRFGVVPNFPRIVVANTVRSYVCINDWTMQAFSEVATGGVGSNGEVVVGLLGDINGDGIGEIGVGWPKFSPFASPEAGRLVVRSCVGAAINWQSVGQVPYAHQGDAFDAIGDWNGDSFLDFAFSSPGRTSPTAVNGSVQVISGRTFTTLDTLTGPPGYGESLTHANDLNGDGRSEVLLGMPWGPAPYAEIVSGGQQATIDAGCRMDLAMVRSSPYGFSPITFQGTVTSSGTNPSGIVVVAVGFRSWPMSIFDPASGCFWYVDVAQPMLINFGFISPGPAIGSYSMVTSVPPTPSLIGESLMAQALSVTDLPFPMSNAIGFVLL